MPIALLTLLSLAVFVMAEHSGGEMNSFYFYKGWNLVYGFASAEQLEGQVLEESNIKAVYAFIPTTQEYARAYPDPEYDKLRQLDDDELLNTAFWVYSDKAESSEYWLETEVVPYDQRQLYSGWNFFGLTSYLINVYKKSRCGLGTQ